MPGQGNPLGNNVGADEKAAPSVVNGTLQAAPDGLRRDIDQTGTLAEMDVFQRQAMIPRYDPSDKGTEPMTEASLSKDKRYGQSYEAAAGVLTVRSGRADAFDGTRTHRTTGMGRP